MSTFAERMGVLSEMVGERDLVASVTFSGEHAAPQHEFSSRFDPPSWAGKTALTYTVAGTGPKYITGPLLERHVEWLMRLARETLREPRGLKDEMEKVAEDWSDIAARLAPRETGDLARSATPRVTDDGRLIYQRVG